MMAALRRSVTDRGAPADVARLEPNGQRRRVDKNEKEEGNENIYHSRPVWQGREGYVAIWRLLTKEGVL